jgi:hypothetical protein
LKSRFAPTADIWTEHYPVRAEFAAALKDAGVPNIGSQTHTEKVARYGNKNEKKLGPTASYVDDGAEDDEATYGEAEDEDEDEDVAEAEFGAQPMAEMPRGQVVYDEVTTTQWYVPIILGVLTPHTGLALWAWREFGKEGLESIWRLRGGGSDFLEYMEELHAHG